MECTPRPRVDKRLLARRRAGHIEVILSRTHRHIPLPDQVECGNAAATRLVYDAIQTGRALHGEREAMLQLAASSGP